MRCGDVIGKCLEVSESLNKKVSTAKLNKWLIDALDRHSHPLVKGKAVKMSLELHLFHDILGCTEQASGNVSIEELRNNLLNPNYSPSCDRPHYVLGVSLATWNLIYLIVALFVSGKVYCGERKKSKYLRCSNNRFLQQAIRVNHAGEYGAICIYSGQKFILKKSSIINEIIEMEEQEKSIFTILMRKSKEQKVRPTVLLPVWRVLGVSLGVATAIMAKKLLWLALLQLKKLSGSTTKSKFHI
ncbi:disulfide bond formation protein DsbB [Trichonephila clavata]|uniref:Disulfide bond formation protein DsbB n=1 Tax=Trichonephila clavata TaxID=2740835 RepID=A0A8X6LKK8_TRICU|nr:disulfide bond formation protein DsbB [Trichonephila clavata]